MCIGITIMTVPPLVATTCYACWFAGQASVLRQQKHTSGSSYVSYAASLLIAIPTYYAQTPLIRWMEGDRSQQQNPTTPTRRRHHQPPPSPRQQQASFVPPHKIKDPAARFQPPQTPGEFWQRMGRPVAARVAALGTTFFCAGAVQAWWWTTSASLLPAAGNENNDATTSEDTTNSKKQ